MNAPLPGYWHFAWMFFMQPLTLHRRLKDCGIDEPNISGWQAWRVRRTLLPAHAGYFRRLGFLLLWPPCAWLMAAELDRALGLGLLLATMAAFMAGNLIVGATLGVVSFAAVGVATGVAFGMAIVVAALIAIGLASGGAASGVAIGVSGGVMVGMAGGMVVSWFAGIPAISATIVAVIATAVFLSGVAGAALTGGVTGGMTSIVAFLLTYFRLPLYPLEALLQVLLHLARSPAHSLRYTPVLHHDLSYLPHPFLARHIVAAAEDDPALAARVLEACRIAPGQRKTGDQALAELQARELAKLAHERAFLDAIDLKGRWLPGRDTESALLRAIAEAARLFAAAKASTSPYLARRHLDQAAAQLQAIANQRLASPETLAAFLPDTLAAWHKVLAEMRADQAAAAAEQLPNPYITGNPLAGEDARDLFRGREATIRKVETLLAGNAASLQLQGPRRCGKSSLINMFKLWLPDTQVVLFDLQQNRASTPEGLYAALVQQTRRQAYEDRRLQLPPAAGGEGLVDIDALRLWLDTLEAFPGVARILICIDEFEGLPKLFAGREAELSHFLGLLRATIQHGRRVRLLLAGAAPFDELDRLWSDYFINLRLIHIGYLDADAALGLLTRPVPDFPEDAIPPAVARAIVTRCGGQPYLVQLYGSLLVDRLNDEKRRVASLEDIEPVEEEVLEQAGNYFTNVWSDLPPAARAGLQALSAGGQAEFDRSSRRWLSRRLVLSETNEFLVPVFGRWVSTTACEECLSSDTPLP